MELKIKGVSLIKCTLKPDEREVTVPRGIRIIEWAAFSSCANLRRVILPEGLFEIRRGAFQGCSRLLSVNLPDRLRVIGEGAFADCTSLRSIILPDSVTTLGMRAFENCSSLAQIKLSSKLQRIDSQTFHNCKSLQKIYLPDSVIEIGQGAFQACAALSQVRCPDSMIAIEERAFRSCLALKQIKMPEKLQQLGDQCFTNCLLLSTLILPEGITRLPNELFSGCMSLTQVVLPASLNNKISRYTHGTFHQCPKLTRIIARGGLCESARYALSFLHDQLQQLFVSSPDDFENTNCFSVSDDRDLMLLALRTYAGNTDRFSDETCRKYNLFLRNHAGSLCEYIIEHADLIELICSKDLLSVSLMPHYIAASLEHPSQLGPLLRYICNKKTFTKKEIFDLIDKTTAIEHGEAAAILLQYQNEHFPAAPVDDDNDDPFSLPDWDDDL